MTQDRYMETAALIAAILAAGDLASGGGTVGHASADEKRWITEATTYLDTAFDFLDRAYAAMSTDPQVGSWTEGKS